ncbi:HD domain-containing protein, partial [bacterium]|nr:HD domain-containing protein [bacterium]
MAGLIHDVGKIQIPTEILIKPDHLSEIEFVMIKMHPRIGYEIVQAIEFPYPVAMIILQHHEKMDGSGYPSGLFGEDILLEARILAVADIVEAMSSHRPYRPALGIGKALEEISKHKGFLYDPGPVNACLKLFYEKKFKLK